MQSDLCFSLEDSLKEVIRALGGAKSAGHKLRPDLDPDAAGRWLLSCLEPERAEKLSLGQLMLILRWGHDAGCHAAMDYIARDSGYAEPAPITPEDEQDELTREFVAGVKTLSGLADRIERIANRAVRPVVVGRKAA